MTLSLDRTLRRTSGPAVGRHRHDPPAGPPYLPPPTRRPPAGPPPYSLLPPTFPPPSFPPRTVPSAVTAPPAPRVRQRGAGRSLGTELVLGRAPGCDIVLDDLRVGLRHAVFVSLPGVCQVVRDLHSAAGTFVNGRRLAPGGRRQVVEGDRIGIGATTFRVLGGDLEAESAGDARLVAHRLTVLVGDEPILRDVSFEAPARSLVAVVGPSGSGKSTLLKALTGYRHADRGEVRYAERNLYDHYGELRSRVGLVPQDDILHPELSVRRALGYAAELRFPAEVTRAERAQRIGEVLRELHLDVHQDKRIRDLSGGQRKRVSVALELLTKPSLMLLDEPTSGLDPGMDRDVMKLLRALADDDRTVIVVTHSVAELDLADRVLVMAPDGSVAYFGPPEDALAFFERASWADVFADFEEDRDGEWGVRWRGSRLAQRYVAAGLRTPRVVKRHGAAPPPGQPWLTQFSTLVRRYLAVIAADPGFIALLVILPVVLGASTLIVKPGSALTSLGYDPSGYLIPNLVASTVLMVVAVGICFTGAANAVRELVKERVIYERERAVGLSRTAYLWSKVVVLGGITAIQALAMTVLSFSVRTLPARGLLLGGHVVAELAIPFMLLGVTSMLVGLVISAAVTTSEKTMPMLVMFAVLQIVFGGCLFSLLGSPANIASYAMPARWGVAATGDTLDLNQLFRDRDAPNRLDPLWDHGAAHWALALVVLVGMCLVCLVAVARFLRQHEPQVMR